MTTAPQLPARPALLSRRTIWTARLIALAADAIQIGLFPFFAGGWVSPANNALDIVVGVLMVRLLGFHWAFLPTFAAELVPVFDVVPTWSAAVFLVTGMQSRPWLKWVLVAFVVAVMALIALGVWWMVRGNGAPA